ncbi:MAG TPA: SHOCT domain-containing protein, partial [Solirubrobacterales bacterium]|nr:SHOCT domain-containing protein [Solirubrobacterales bacterium]
MLEYPDADYAGLREFGERSRDRAREAWAGRPKNISMPKIGGKGGAGGEGTAAGGGTGEAETTVLPAQPPASSPEDSRLDQLEKLGRLKEAGVLDDEEFAAEKKRILGG